MKSDIPTMRPHHLLCLQGFRGLGYDERFVALARKLMSRLTNEPGVEVRIVFGPDSLCEACPMLQGSDRCDLAQRLDAVVAERLGMIEGQIVQGAEAFRRARESFDPEDIAALCVGCVWLETGWCAEALG